MTSSSFLSIAFPITLQYFSGWMAAGLFLAIGAVIVLMGMRSLAGLGPVRKWVAMGIRLAVLLLFVLIIGGARWQRQHKDVEVLLINDLSESISNVTDFPGNIGANRRSIQQALDDYYRSLGNDPTKKSADRIGIISFGAYAKVDAMPNRELRLDTRGLPDDQMRQGTNGALALQLALASMSPEAMHRFVLVSDGNFTQGDIDSAVNAAVAQHVPIDIVPLKYDAQNEVLMDRFEAPSQKRENEPFTLRVVLRSTNSLPVSGKLRVQHITAGGGEGQNFGDIDMDPTTAAMDRERAVTLRPGLNVELVKVPALQSPGVHRFKATFTPDKPAAGTVTATVSGPPGMKSDLLEEGRTAEAFTFVQGKGKVLYVDNTGLAGAESPGALLAKAMAEEKIALETIGIDQFPQNVLDLQSYDAVILANVAKGSAVSTDASGVHLSGLSDLQDAMLRTYVHDMGGGLVMIGGEQAFGAGGWEGSEVEKILPVDMAIPAQRQIGKGALVLIMHSCEMPQGNYYGEMCARQAIKVLSPRDEIGIISYGNGGAGPAVGGAQWDYPLSEKGDGSRVDQAIRKMQLGDMPSFDDSMNLALNGVATTKGLKQSNARHKHVIIISDGDPSAPIQSLMDQYKAGKISVSTVTVYPHTPNQARPPTMDAIPAYLGGKAYGPVESNPQQLPQIFIKEATIVKRSLIHEPDEGIAIKVADGGDEMVKGVPMPPPMLRGMVLVSRKNDPRVEMPFSAGVMNDPILAHWQAGLGKSAVWTSDATSKWGPAWVSSPAYPKMWAQIIRAVSRPPMSPDFDVRTTIEGNKGEVVVEALNKEGDFANFLNIGGTVAGGKDFKQSKVRLVQVGPGIYKGTFDAPSQGTYVAVLNAQGRNAKSALLPVSGAVLNGSPERHDLKSNPARMEQIRAATGGRALEAFSANGAEIFTRDGLFPGASPLPVWDLLVPILLGLIILDVAVRRIAWDWAATKRLAFATAEHVRGFTVIRKVESRQTLDALKKVRDEVAETKLKPAAPTGPPRLPTGPRPDPKAKFEARAGVEGDITQVVGGATDKPIPPPPKKTEPKGGSAGGHMGGLMAAKKRAQQQIKEKEQGEGDGR